jgi:hypothetical protein
LSLDAPANVKRSGRRVACASWKIAARHGFLYRSSRFNALRSRRGDRSTLVFLFVHKKRVALTFPPLPWIRLRFLPN